MVNFNEWDYLNYELTILDNPYIDFELYDKQALVALTSCHRQDGINETLAGGPGGGGKTRLLAALALQFVEFPQYRCLVTRKNYRELIGTGSVFDIIKNIPGVKSRESGLIRIIFPSGAEIHFKAFNDESHKQDVKGESYHTILNDEASELAESVLRFLYRSLRKKVDDWIPLRFINASNPGGESTDYLLNEYVDGDLPYVEMGYKDNPYIDNAVYEEALSNLDYIDQQYQMYGNWHYTPSQGDLISIEELQKGYIDYSDYNKYSVMYNVIGIDLAGNGRDNTSPVSLILLNNGLIVCNDIRVDESSYPESTIYDAIETQAETNNLYQVLFEREPGSDSLYSLRYWKQDVLLDLIEKYGINIDDVAPAHNKFTRARPVAKAIKNGVLKFDSRLKEVLEKKQGLFEQFIKISPLPEVMKKQKSPDELDALGYAYDHLKQMGETRDTYGTGKQRYKRRRK